MNDEEKERIKHLIERCNECKLNACITCDICWSEVQAIEKMYNLVEKQQAEIEKYKILLAETNVQFLNSDLKTKRKNEKDLEMLYKGCQIEIETLKRDFEIVDHECFRLEQEDIKKDKLINILAEQLTTPVHSKEWVIDYYKREIEKC